MNQPNDQLVFELRGVELAGSGGIAGVLDRGLRLRARAGEAVRIHDAPLAGGQALADVLSGHRLPAAGEARFRGRAWGILTGEARSRQQASLRRVFPTPRWLGYLPADEEVLLFDRYHRRRPEAQRLEEAAAWCRHFGLPGIPTARPATLPILDQHRAALARAFLGQPRGLILHLPAEQHATGLHQPLADAIAQATGRGAAVILITAARRTDLPGVRPLGYHQLSDQTPRGQA